MRSAVLLLVFNRPDTTKQVFEAIRKAQPPRLYVAADGPRDNKSGEREKCEKVRQITENIDWNCEVKTLFREKNLGCKIGVSSGIDWFFENEEEGIILEDDILPSDSFFLYCDQLLERYRFDTRVGQICGFNSLDNYKVESDYYFSKYGPIWGWASWRRAWRIYDVEMQIWPKIKREKKYKSFVRNKDEERFRVGVFDSVYQGEIDTWDYQWVFGKLVNSMLSIIPLVNLVDNIGFDETATHTKIKPSYISGESRKCLKIKKHPDHVLNDFRYEKMYFDRFVKKKGLFYRMIDKIRKLI